ncbi:MAG: hypothetical protein GAK43_01443 [Stenotrophomonas maltophilia]|nr:MAG: hypothetical protein GAK43_01443 [Stenotrophomonas maltophilia]
MRMLCVLALLLGVTGCNSLSTDRYMNDAYTAYNKGDCGQVMLNLSQAQRYSRARPWLQPEISMLRGQCLERQKYFIDAVQTYQFIIVTYPTSEYAYRAKSRLETLRMDGHMPSGVVVQPARP